MSRPPWPWLLLWAASLAMALLGPKLFDSDASREAAVVFEDDAAHVVSSRIDDSSSHGPSASEIRAIVREEMRATCANDTENLSSSPEQEDHEAVRARLDATNETRAMVDRAVATGRWSEDDDTALMEKLGPLSENDRENMLSTLYSAINRGEILVEGAPSSAAR